MECSDPRRADEDRARAALERMDDDALAMATKMMEEMAKKHPRQPRTDLAVIKEGTKRHD